MGKKKTTHTLYYELLGIETDATPEQIKKAYRKKALQLHPDKRGNTKEAQDEFTHMKQAYDVLSDPQKKEVYDQAGEDGIKLMENYGNMSADEMTATLFRSFGAFGTKGKVALISVVTLLFSFFLIIPIFWCLRVDNTVSWNWVLVFLPMWLLDAVYFCCLGCVSLSSDAGMDPEDRKQKKPGLYKLYRFLKQLLLLALQIFIAMKLNHDVSWSVREVFIPYFVFEALSFIETLASGVVGYKALTKDSAGAGVSTTEAIKQQRTRFVSAIALQLVLAVARLVQGVLVSLKIDGELGTTSWWLVFLPIWVYLGYFASFPIKRYLRVRAKAKDPKPAAESTLPTHDAYTRESVPGEHDSDDMGSKYPLLDVCCTITCIAIVASPYFILTSRLEDGTFSAFYVLLPWFIIAGLVLCFICCAISCIGVSGDDEADGDVRSPTGDEGADLTTEYVAVEVKGTDE